MAAWQVITIIIDHVNGVFFKQMSFSNKTAQYSPIGTPFEPDRYNALENDVS